MAILCVGRGTRIEESTDTGEKEGKNYGECVERNTVSDSWSRDTILRLFEFEPPGGYEFHSLGWFVFSPLTTLISQSLRITFSDLQSSLFTSQWDATHSVRYGRWGIDWEIVLYLQELRCRIRQPISGPSSPISFPDSSEMNDISGMLQPHRIVISWVSMSDRLHNEGWSSFQTDVHQADSAVQKCESDRGTDEGMFITIVVSLLNWVIPCFYLLVFNTISSMLNSTFSGEIQV